MRRGGTGWVFLYQCTVSNDSLSAKCGYSLIVITYYFIRFITNMIIWACLDFIYMICRTHS